jgi:hypothetical protein
VIRTIGAMSPLDQIRESIEARIAELKNEINALQAARAALHANRAINNTADASTKSAWEPPTKPSKSATPVKVLLAGKLEAMLSETEDGLSANAWQSSERRTSVQLPFRSSSRRYAMT